MSVPKRLRTTFHPDWARPAAASLDSSVDTLYFQVMDFEQVLPKDKTRDKASLRLFGVNAEQNSVYVHLTGFEPFFWVRMPENFVPLRDCVSLMAALNSAIDRRNSFSNAILRLEPAQRTDVYGYHFPQPFIRVVVHSPRVIPWARSAIEAGISISSLGQLTLKLYESNIEYILQQLVHTNIVGCGWLQFLPGTYKLEEGKLMSNCQIEATASCTAVRAISTEERSEIAPIRTLSFDIECAGRPNIFPVAEIDPVIQVKFGFYFCFFVFMSCFTTPFF
jgi:DNA polymerase delta subunit 1